VITLTLLHPLQSTPVQSWTFYPDSAVRVGRANDNDVILFSAVVSRHHLEFRPNDKGSSWELVSLGANGTYVDGEKITQLPVIDGMIVRLASSGPKIQVRLGAVAAAELKSKVKLPGEQRTPVNKEPPGSTFINSPKPD
jgi:pSer/pThr/pTyr-binding forkhead associated (FHA) protein